MHGFIDKMEVTFFLLSAAPNTKELDVYIKRNQESGFGFRVLGGEGPDQPVRNSSAAPFTTRLDIRMAGWQMINGAYAEKVYFTFMEPKKHAQWCHLPSCLYKSHGAPEQISQSAARRNEVFWGFSGLVVRLKAHDLKIYALKMY